MSGREKEREKKEGRKEGEKRDCSLLGDRVEFRDEELLFLSGCVPAFAKHPVHARRGKKHWKKRGTRANRHTG